MEERQEYQIRGVTRLISNRVGGRYLGGIPFTTFRFKSMLPSIHRFVALPFLVLTCTLPACAQQRMAPDEFQRFSDTFWEWRARTQPASGDDITRLERPLDWRPDWSPEAVAEIYARFDVLHTQWERFDTTGWSIPAQVDYRLLGSGLSRIKWELDLSGAWKRNPLFYVNQTLGPIFDLLLPPPPFDSLRVSHLIARLNNFSPILEAAEQNLTESIRPFAELAIAGVAVIPDQLRAVSDGLKAFLSEDEMSGLNNAVESAADATIRYGDWLRVRLSDMRSETAVGPEAYAFFLKNVALMPFEADELVAMARREWERSVAFESIESQKNEGIPELPLFPDQETQIAATLKYEIGVRDFLETNDLLTVPAWMGHYGNAPIPGYLAPIGYIGVIDDLTSESRLDENAIKYIFPPSPDLGYFHLSMAKDPRPILVHEGVPGHYFQLALSWVHDDPIRRHYYDSGANEGIGFYAEEMMLQAGYFDDSPKTREIIYNYMRLRALRVEVDVKLAIGEFSIPEAADYLEKTVPMDQTTARQEAAFFASTPGQAISYQIGKSQIIKFLSDARSEQGRVFDLRSFHDFVWENGNVPIALQRWEWLGLKDEINTLDS